MRLRSHRRSRAVNDIDGRGAVKTGQPMGPAVRGGNLDINGQEPVRTSPKSDSSSLSCRVIHQVGGCHKRFARLSGDPRRAPRRYEIPEGIAFPRSSWRS